MMYSMPMLAAVQFNLKFLLPVSIVTVMTPYCLHFIFGRHVNVENVHDTCVCYRM